MDELKQRFKRGLISQAEYMALKAIEAKAPKKNKVASTTKQGKRCKYVCPMCKAAVWAKWGLGLKCNSGHIDQQMEALE